MPRLDMWLGHTMGCLAHCRLAHRVVDLADEPVQPAVAFEHRVVLDQHHQSFGRAFEVVRAGSRLALMDQPES